MKLSDLEFIKLLPQFMRNDAAVRGLSAGIDGIVPQLAADIEKLSTWDSIDKLSEAELDELAWELNIPWYDKGATIEVKRHLILDSDKVYKKLGTKWAAENVINTYFGDGYIEEWFQYNGEPGHFRVHSTNPSLNESRFAEFLNLLNKVKRASAKLDGVYITSSAQMNLFAGTAVHEISVERYDIGAAAPI